MDEDLKWILSLSEEKGKLRGAIQAFLIDWDLDVHPPSSLARSVELLRQVYNETAPDKPHEKE